MAIKKKGTPFVGRIAWLLWLWPFIVPAALAAASDAKGELIHVSLMKKPTEPFRLKRNPFSLAGFVDASASGRAAATSDSKKEEEEKQQNLEEEIRQSITYNGFIKRQGEKAAILNISGEYVEAKEGDIVMEKIKIIKIEPAQVTIEYQNQTFEINAQGEDDE